MDPAWCLVMVDDPWLWTPGKTSGFDVPGNVRPLATRETPGDETPGDEIPGDVRPLATRETPGDDDPWTYGPLAMKWFGEASTALLIPIIVTWDSWAAPGGLWPLGSGSATLTWALIRCNILQMNMILLSGWRWGLFPYHPGGECAGSENGNSYDCLRSVSSGVETSSAGQRVWRTQRKNDGTVTLLERTLYTGRLAQDQCRAQDPAVPTTEVPSPLVGHRSYEQERGAVRKRVRTQQPSTRARDPISCHSHHEDNKAGS